MPWREMKLRNAKVFVRCDEAGAPRAEGGRVEVRYKRDDGRAYRASVRNLVASPSARVYPDSHCGDAAPVAAKSGGAGSKRSGGGKKKRAKAAPPPPHEPGALIVYADGACSGNPGPAGAGVVVLDGDARHELSEYVGRGTNNIAELTAILRAAEHLNGRSEPVRIYTDSQYSIGVLTKGWKAKKNTELIVGLRAKLQAWPTARLKWVKGHAGHVGNTRADELAVAGSLGEDWVRWSDGSGNG